MEGEHRVFKEGAKTGAKATDARRRGGLRKQKERRQNKLAMRRGHNHAATMTSNDLFEEKKEKKRTDIVEFRELREKVKQALREWFAYEGDLSTPTGMQLATHAMEGLSTALFFRNRDLALSAYPDFFSGQQGQQLLVRLTIFVGHGPGLGRLFQMAVNCVTEIMYEPENIACVEILCHNNIHGIALNHLFLVTPETSEMRQELLEMLGNTARNNQYARQIVLETAGLMEMIDTNLSDAVARGDWALISAVFYMMYALCETCKGGETPPLSLFEPVMPNFILTLSQVSPIPSERTRDIDGAYIAGIDFLEALCLADGRTTPDMTPLMVERRRGVLRLASDANVQGIIFQATACGNRSVQKKAIATLSFMCTFGVDAIHPLVKAGLVPILVAPLQNVSIEPYSKRHILRMIFLLTKYDGAYMQLLIDHGVLEYLCQAVQGFMGSLDTQQLNYAAWALCRAILCNGNPLTLKQFLSMLCSSFSAVASLTEALHRFVTGGDMETCNDILSALCRIFEFIPKQSQDQFEEHDGLAALSKIMHQSHVESDPYKRASFLHDTYFGDY